MLSPMFILFWIFGCIGFWMIGPPYLMNAMSTVQCPYYRRSQSLISCCWAFAKGDLLLLRQKTGQYCAPRPTTAGIQQISPVCPFSFVMEHNKTQQMKIQLQKSWVGQSTRFTSPYVQLAIELFLHILGKRARSWKWQSLTRSQMIFTEKHVCFPEGRWKSSDVSGVLAFKIMASETISFI